MFFTCLPPTPGVRIIWLCVNVLGCAPSADWMCPELNILRVLPSNSTKHLPVQEGCRMRWLDGHLGLVLLLRSVVELVLQTRLVITQRDLPVSASLVLGWKVWAAANHHLAWICFFQCLFLCDLKVSWPWKANWCFSLPHSNRLFLKAGILSWQSWKEHRLAS